MKKKLLSFAFFLVALSVWGQSKKVQFGFNTGLTASDIFYDKFDVKFQKLGIQFGGFLDFFVRDVYWISTGLKYTQLGDYQKFQNDPTIPTFVALPISAAKQINYIQVPILFSMRERTLRIDAGLYGGYALSGFQQWKMTVESTSDKQDLLIPDSEIFRRYDSGLQIGAGYVSKMGIDIMFNAQIGVVKLERFVSAFTPLPFPVRPFNNIDSDNFKGKNISIGLNVGYRF